MRHLENPLPVLPFTSLHEVPIGCFRENCAGNWLVASLFTVPAAPLPLQLMARTSVYTPSSEFPHLLHDNITSFPNSVATAASSRIVLDKAALGAISAATPQISAGGSDFGLHAVSSEFPPSLHDDSASPPSSVAITASSTVVLDKAALGTIPRALPVHKDLAVRQTDSGSQAPSAAHHLA